MRAKAHVYDLSYVSPSRRKQTKPKLVFTLRARELPFLVARLRQMTKMGVTESQPYLGFDSHLSLGEDNLFKYFGFGHCGTMKWIDDEVQISFELDAGMVIHYVALSVCILVNALSSPLTEESLTNRVQLLDLFTSCKMGEVYGHAVGGHVSSSVVNWLKDQTRQSGDDTEMPKEVIVTMQEVWRACRPSDHVRDIDCGGMITKDGRFMLRCPGNACDIAIYPDMMYSDADEYGAGLSCHNLDTAIQQMTLLAGLAKLCELVRREI